MPRLRLESPTDALDLDGVTGSGVGIAALDGVTGTGLPPVSTQWIEGAGDGATYRGERVLPRDLDLPLFVQAADRDGLRALTSRLALMLAGPMTLRFIEDDGSSWTLDVRRVGGGSVSLGAQSVVTDWLATVVTVRAGDPFWTSSAVTRREISSAAGRGLLADPDGAGALKRSLVTLRLSASQTLGSVFMENPGDAPAFPVWTVTGPGQDLVITSASGETFEWNGSLSAGETLTVDTRAATVRDNTGASRYAQLAPAPRLWRIPPGATTANVALANTDSGSKIVAEWRARRWTVL